jgi:thiol-disulfide isomerase/thioredoxin
MQFLTRPVFYFEEDDFDEKGNITKIHNSKPVFILIQSLKCYHCTKSKPAFQEFAERNKNKVMCGTIQMDSPKMTPEFINKLKYIYPDLVGFPSYILYSNGKKIVYDGERTVKDMEKFITENNI